MIAQLEALFGDRPPSGNRLAVDIAGQKEGGLEPASPQLWDRHIKLRPQRIVIGEYNSRLSVIRPFDRLGQCPAADKKANQRQDSLWHKYRSPTAIYVFSGRY
ncbi:hypothetical protein GCM10011511_28510 [Puia dinghuensis]|uniref:Uncharacterized protein n=1 Tax=Puia dinghuensis TaxID=1792502 RepID=A0A8J2UEB0_9BACT|nr:hypothetical protein GCM10011511_28510 [Puia dinghuensis]